MSLKEDTGNNWFEGFGLGPKILVAFLLVDAYAIYLIARQYPFSPAEIDLLTGISILTFSTLCVGGLRVYVWLARRELVDDMLADLVGGDL